MFIRHRLGPYRSAILISQRIILRGEKTYFVCIMTNRSKTLYTGVTESLVRRVHEHKQGAGSSFTSKYKMDRLVYCERFQDIHNSSMERLEP